jgi:hypothetical protein
LLVVDLGGLWIGRRHKLLLPLFCVCFGCVFLLCIVEQ